VRDWPAAGRDYRRAIDLAPRHSLARQQYALWLSYQEQFEDALKEARLAESFDPLSPAAANNVAEVFRQARRIDEAMAQAQHALALNPNFGRAHAVMAQCYLGQGRPDLAIEEFQRSGTFNGILGFAYAQAGRIAEARRLVETLEPALSVGARRAGRNRTDLHRPPRIRPCFRVAVARGRRRRALDASRCRRLRPDPIGSPVRGLSAAVGLR
jgi:tetratricopeptide (TPR) repeat protein